MRPLTLFIISALLPFAAFTAQAQSPEPVARFYGPMPTGVTVSHTGRVFVNFPHWGDDVKFTVAEVVNGQAVAYPNAEVNKINKANPAACLYSVQSVVVDPKDRLWALDTGSLKLGPNVAGGPKLVCIDLTTNTITRKIFFPRSVVTPATYLNDVRFDLRRGKAGTAFITDSGGKSDNGIIIVDLASGKSFRRLGKEPSVKPDTKVIGIVDGFPLMERKHGLSPQVPKFASDGIAISRDGNTLYYCPISSRQLYSVSIDAMVDRSKSESEVAATIKDLGVKGMSDGLESDAAGGIYAGDEEQSQVKYGKPGGPYKLLAQVPKRFWIDTLSVATNGYLYFTANELALLPTYHNDKDLRVKPYLLYRTKISAQPVLLK
ncbi:MAG: L-dopachrome tautomerase-related protein [Janthinobacterium lividum]